MTGRECNQPGMPGVCSRSHSALAGRAGARRRAAAGPALLAVLLGLAACGSREPEASVSELNWACGASRCTASFRVQSDGSGDQSLLVMVRAYAGGSVAERHIVGEHKTHLRLPSGQSKRLTVSVDTREAANRLRVMLEQAP
jgi:hypothetical protein